MPVRTKAKSLAKLRVYLSTRIVPRWRREIQSGQRALFFSPYVTGRCADQVLLVAGGDEVELYTVFRAENFASGASSLRCLQRLIEGGVKVYHLPDLHAKMLLVPGQVVTIGSQNLTSGGLRNREATVLLSDQKAVGQAEAEAMEWLKDRLPVTPEMIADLGKHVRRLKNLFKSAKGTAREVDEQVKYRQRERDDEAWRKREEEERRRRRLMNLRGSVRKLRMAGERVQTQVQLVRDWSRKKKQYISTATLMVRGNCSLTRWRFDGEIVELEDCYRYLCLIEETGKLGWARVASTRITFISPLVVHGEWVFFGNWTWKVTAEGIWTGQRESGSNLFVKMKSNFRGEAHLHCWFSVDGLEVEKAAWKTPPSKASPPPDLAVAFANNQDRIRDQITKLLVKPFKFSDGQKLTGPNTINFFGEVYNRYIVRLAQVGEHKILIASGRRP